VAFFSCWRSSPTVGVAWAGGVSWAGSGSAHARSVEDKIAKHATITIIDFRMLSPSLCEQKLFTPSTKTLFCITTNNLESGPCQDISGLFNKLNMLSDKLLVRAIQILLHF
jgi:hypothetical protein